MQVSDWMTATVCSVKPRDNAYHARTLLEQHRINQLPVVVNGKLLGIVTDRDLRDAFPSVFDAAALDDTRAKGHVDPGKVLIESVMTANVLTIAPTEELTDAATTLRRERVGALPVVAGGKLVGILTRSNVIDAFLSREGVQVSAATQVQARSKPTAKKAAAKKTGVRKAGAAAKSASKKKAPTKGASKTTARPPAKRKATASKRTKR